jgi:hypothetical protein
MTVDFLLLGYYFQPGVVVESADENVYKSKNMRNIQLKKKNVFEIG